VERTLKEWRVVQGRVAIGLVMGWIQPMGDEKEEERESSQTRKAEEVGLLVF
jgi:hypothetical protein